MKLLVAIPSNRDWKVAFGQSLLGLAAHVFKLGIETLFLPSINVSLLPLARQAYLNRAIEEDFTHLLFIDDDMKFSTEAFDFLISRNVDIVAANYTRKDNEDEFKGVPLKTTASKDGMLLFSNNKSGCEKVDSCGFGFCLIKIDSIKKIPEPHFEIVWDKVEKRYIGEDTRFCEILNEHNIDIHIDHDASRHVSHIGDYFFHEKYK
jgi:hypothetical protein